MLESLKEKEFVASRLQLTIAIWRSPRLSGVTQKVIWACSLKHCRLYDCQGKSPFVIGTEEGGLIDLWAKPRSIN